MDQITLLKEVCARLSQGTSIQWRTERSRYATTDAPLNWNHSSLHQEEAPTIAVDDVDWEEVMITNRNGEIRGLVHLKS